MEDNDFDSFLHALDDADSPQKLAALIETNRADDKLRMRADEEHRKVVAKCHALLLHAQQHDQVDKLVKVLKKKDASIKSNDTHLVLLRAFIDFGVDGKQFASRDKANLLLLEADKVPADRASQFIKEKGGLVACADLWRKRKRGHEASTEKDDGKKHTLAWVRREHLKGPDDMVVLVVRLDKKAIRIARSFELLPISDVAERKKFYNELKAKLKKRMFGETVD